MRAGAVVDGARSSPAAAGHYWPVAQWLERRPYKATVPGSSPGGPIHFSSSSSSSSISQLENKTMKSEPSLFVEIRAAEGGADAKLLVLTQYEIYARFMDLERL